MEGPLRLPPRRRFPSFPLSISARIQSLRPAARRHKTYASLTFSTPCHARPPAGSLRSLPRDSPPKGRKKDKNRRSSRYRPSSLVDGATGLLPSSLSSPAARPPAMLPVRAPFRALRAVPSPVAVAAAASRVPARRFYHDKDMSPFSCVHFCHPESSAESSIPSHGGEYG